ncbi:MAG: chitobiase/beta-hexosaminidase C-terminal domain-containing protein [Bacteroidetes bacterium]|nr:chitobiase/beta-hexosaminidase C-terminal domain-containing protein [Bacteroidota bacterium]
MKQLLFALFCLFTFVDVHAQEEKKWTALHVINYTSDQDLEILIHQLPQLSQMGINMLMLEVNYNFEFATHPELIEGNNPITKAGAKRFAGECKKNGIRLIPEFQSIGHQSWKDKTTALLRKYPELDLTPNAFPNNDSIYCREWDITNPKVNEIIFPMIDEIIEAFEADGIHVGMDEIFLIGNKNSAATFGKNPAKLFALAINEFHDHVVKEKKLQMFIWGDRLIEAKQFNYGIWEASATGTATAIDMIPKDIIICDWHYNSRPSYPSVDLFINKGFQVLPCSHKEVDAAQDFIKYTFAMQNPSMVGHCFTTWGAVKKDELISFPAMIEGLSTIKKQKYFDVSVSYLPAEKPGEILTQLKTAKKELSIYYTLDGSEPDPHKTKYIAPVVITNNCTLRAKAFNQIEAAGDEFSEVYYLHKSVGKEIKLTNAPSAKYSTKRGAATLLNGISGSASFSDGEWLGFEGQDLEAIITINHSVDISSVTINFHNQVNSWIHHPEKFEIYSSEDGKVFTLIASKTQNKIGKQTVGVKIDFPILSTQYLKVVAKKTIIPEGFPGEGQPAWIFADEIIIE